MKPDLTLDIRDIFNRSIVYGLKRDNEYIYIGMSSVGLSRINGNHHIFSKNQQPGDVIDIWYTSDPRGLETQLIRLYKPRLNVKKHLTETYNRCHSCKRKFKFSKKDKEIMTPTRCPPCLHEMRINNLNPKQIAELIKIKAELG